MANSRIDCRDNGAWGEGPSGDKTRIAISQRKSTLGGSIGQPDFCNRASWNILVGVHRLLIGGHRREGGVLRAESIRRILILGVHKADRRAPVTCTATPHLCAQCPIVPRLPRSVHCGDEFDSRAVYIG